MFAMPKTPFKNLKADQATRRKRCKHVNSIQNI